MQDKDKTKNQLLLEMSALRQRVAELETLKTAEQQMEERRLFLERILACAPDAIVTLDREHHILEWNRGAEELFGYSQDEALGCDLDDLIAVHSSEKHREAIGFTQQALSGKPVPPTETTRYRKDGTPIQVSLAGSPILVQDEVIGTVAVYTDITARKEAERALQESEESCRMLLERSLQGIMIVQEVPPRILFANQACADIVGCALEQLLSLTPDQALALVHPEDQAMLIPRLLEHLMGAPVPPSGEFRLLFQDGSIRWVEYFAGLIEYKGQPAVQVAFIDITKRRQAEEEIRQLKEFNENIVQNMAEGIVVQDADGHLAFVNPAAAAMLGYKPEDLIDRDWIDIVPPDQIGIVRAADERRKQGESDRYEIELVRSDGNRLPVLVSGNPRFDPDTGEFDGTLAVFTDISARVQAEAQVARHAREMAALYETSLEINSQPDLSALLQAIVQRASDLLSAKMGGLYLVYPDRGELELVVGHNLPGHHIGTRLQLGEGLSGRIALTGEPLMVDDYHQWEGQAAVYTGYPFRRVLGVPLKVGERVIGAINISDDVRTGPFEADEIQLVSLFADQAAIAIENAQLFRIVEEAKREWETTFDAMHDAIASVDHTHCIMRANRAFANLVKKEFRKIIGQRHEAILEDVLGRDLLCELDRAIHSGQQMVRVHQRGKRVYEVQITPVSKDSDEAPAGIARAIYVIHEITEAKRAEEEIRRRNRELALLNRIIAASAVSQEIEPILETVCRELALLFEVPQSAAALFNEEKTEAVVVAEYLAEGRPPSLGEIIPAIDNASSQFLLVHKAPLAVRDAQTDPRFAAIHDLMRRRGTVSVLILPLIIEGEVVGSLGVDAIEPRIFAAEEIDLAQRVAEQVSGSLARARLAETQRRLSAAVEQAAEGVIITDTNSTILYANPAVERITGLDVQQVVGKSTRAFRRHGQDGILDSMMWQMVTSGQAWQGRLAGKTPDGSPYTVDSTVTPVRNRAGDIVNYVGTVRDVTREVQLEEQFHQAQKMEALGRLAGGIAHDFNNLLTVIYLSSRLLQRRLRPEDPLWEHVKRIQETSDRATTLTRQLLSFSRQEVIEPKVLNLSQIVGDLSRMLQRIIGEDVTMQMLLADDLWPLRADPSKLDQVIMNLVVNARDAMPQGGTLTITTAKVTFDEVTAASEAAIEPGDYVMLAVGDTGIGIDEEAQSHLFEPFFTTKERGQGTGLGLSTVFGIIKQINGHIRVRSRVDEGTTFEIYLPRAEQSPIASREQARPSLVTSLVRGNETVLVVEDEAAVRELTMSVLKACGYQALAAANGPEALQISEQFENPIDLLITDVVMPHMDGRQLAEQLKIRNPNLQVLYMSGYASKEIAEDGILAPGARFLPKPFTIEELTEKVRVMLDERA